MIFMKGNGDKYLQGIILYKICFHGKGAFRIIGVDKNRNVP